MDVTWEEYLKKGSGQPRTQVFLNLLGPQERDEMERLCAEKQEFTDIAMKTRPIPLIEGAFEFVERLHAAEVDMGVVSVSSTPQEMLSSAGLADFFSLVLGRNDVVVPKPDPEGYLRAMTFYGQPAEATLVLEDSPKGVTAGKRAGCFVCAIATTHTPDELHEADRVVENFKELEYLFFSPSEA